MASSDAFYAWTKNSLFSEKQVCDRNIDCFDGSDELLCSNQSVAQALVGDEGSRCPPGHMHCNSSTECVAMDKVLCNFSVECKDQINQRFCRHEQRFSDFMQCWAMQATIDNYFTVLATRCDNRPECRRMEDECESQCDRRPSFCDDECGNEIRSGLNGNHVCDGYINDVIPGSDIPGLDNCSREVEENCPMRFPCKSKDMISIDKRYYCDGILHCDDHSDETSADCLNNDSTAQQLEAPFPSEKSLFVMELKIATKVKMKVVNSATKEDFTAKVENQYQSIKSLFKMA